MSNLDITTLKEKLKNIPTPQPRTIDCCDEYPTSYGDATMRHSAPRQQSNQVSDSYHNSYHKQETNIYDKDCTLDEQSFILQQLQTIIKQLFTGVNMVGIPAPGTIFSKNPNQISEFDWGFLFVQLQNISYNPSMINSINQPL